MPPFDPSPIPARRAQRQSSRCGLHRLPLALLVCAVGVHAAGADAGSAAGPAPEAAAPGTEAPATLEVLLTLARERQPELHAMQLEAEAAGQRVLPAGALPDPMFQTELRDVTNAMSGGGLNVLPARVGSTRYQLRQTFPSWGRRDARREAAQAGADEAARRADATWRELVMRLKTAHARWQQAQGALVQTRALQALAARLEAVATTRYASGQAAQQDVIRAQVERTALATEIAMLEADAAASRARVNGLVSRPADAPLADAPADAMPAPAALDAVALHQRLLERSPLLAADAARVRAAERNQDAVWANRYPEVTVGVAPVQVRNRFREWELMVEVNIPLQQGSRRAEEREAAAMLAAARARRDATANELATQLNEQLATLSAARRVEALTRTSLLPQSELTLQAALAGYEAGKVDFASVLEAQGQVRKAQLGLIKTRAEARMRLAEIERLLGDDL